jgi:predicted GNAT family acetyltransferase
MINIKHNNSENNGQFTLLDSHKEIELITYILPSNNKMVIEHPEVSSDYKGEGLGEKLIYEGVEFARKENLKISPKCSFSKRIFLKMKKFKT